MSSLKFKLPKLLFGRKFPLMRICLKPVSPIYPFRIILSEEVTEFLHNRNIN